MSDEPDHAEIQREIRKEIDAMNRELEEKVEGESEDGDDEVRHITAEENTKRWNGHWYDGDGDRERVDGRLVQSQLTSRGEEPTEEEIVTLQKKLEERTTLSEQESKVVSLIHLEPSEICERLDITRSHYDTLVHSRIPGKLQKAESTVEETEGHFNTGPIEDPEPDRHAHSIAACGGPGLYGYDECQNDIEINVKNPEFDHHIELTMNYHDYDEVGRNHTKARFCSMECMEHFVENDLALYFADQIRDKKVPRTFVSDESFDDDGTFIGWADGHENSMPVWKVALQNESETMGSEFELAHESVEEAIERAKKLFSGDEETAKIRTIERID